MKKEELEELKKKYDDKIAELKKQRNDKIKKANARINKEEILARNQLRKSQTRVKIIIGAWAINQMKQTKNIDSIDCILKELKNDRDKKLFETLKQTIKK